MQAILFFLSLVFCQSVFSMDIYSSNDREAFKIEVSKTSDEFGRELVGFKICNIYNLECERLGGRDFYLRKELAKRHKLETFQAVLYTMGYSITLLAGNWFVGFSYSHLIINKAAYFLTIPATSYLSHRMISFFDLLNPMTQIGQARATSDQILSDRDVEVADIEKTAIFISTVLNKIDKKDLSL
jgi:hypothetical protein